MGVCVDVSEHIRLLIIIIIIIIIIRHLYGAVTCLESLQGRLLSQFFSAFYYCCVFYVYHF